MKKNLAAFIVGLTFSIGLGISGMTDPQKVIGFLDVFGTWDPSLMFVMGGAIFVHFFTYRWIMKRPSPLLDSKWHLPSQFKITPQLIVGSIIFGLGWGLAGYCPGPALTSIATLNSRPLLFVGSMILGMLFFKLIDKKVGFKR